MHPSRLAERWNHKCAYCDRPLDITLPYKDPYAATCDHFIPRAKGGHLSSTNSVFACKTCNNEKGSVDPRRLIWVWLRIDPRGLMNALLVALDDPTATPPTLKIVVDNTSEDVS